MKISVLIISLVLAGCASIPMPHKPAPIAHAKIVKHPDPCPCSPTANQVVQKRWFSGWKFFH